MILETERLILRPWEESDAESLFEYAKDERVGPAAGWPPHTSVENSREIITKVLSGDEAFAICLKKDNRAIGCIELMRGTQSGLALHENDGEIGYWLGVPFWGQGLMPEAVRELIRHAFVDLRLETLWCGYFDGNEKSKRVQEKCGFIYHHTKKDIYWKMMDKTLTEHITRLTKEEWEKGISIRPYKSGDETEMSALVAYTLKISNRKDYPREYIDEAVREHSPAFFAEKAKESHFYVACDGRKIVGCGGITGYWGSTTESYLLSFFVLPEYQGRGIGRRIIETIEKDEFFKRAWRTEVGSSITAVDFYRKFGYEFKNGVTSPDEYNVIRLEKRKI